MDQVSRVDSWITQLPVSFPANDVIMTTRRDLSLGKRRRPNEDENSDQSASVTSSPNPLGLRPHNITSHPSNSSARSQRISSSSRTFTGRLLRAIPSVTTNDIDMKNVASDYLDRILAVRERLHSKSCIPGCFKELIESNPVFRLQSVAFTFTETGGDSLSHPDLCPSLRAELQHTWDHITQVYHRSKVCAGRNRDENAWSQFVVAPLVNLAIKLSGNGKFMLENVQSQTIVPAYLSVDRTSGKPLDKKTDFTLSYSYEHQHFAGLYQRFYREDLTVSHVSDVFNMYTVFYSGIEVKPKHGILVDAENQISVWMAASLRKKAELAAITGFPATLVPIEPALVVAGEQWHLYLAYLQPDEDVHVLRIETMSTETLSGCFQILKCLQNIVEYGLEGLEGEEKAGFWGGFLGPVLERLVSGSVPGDT